MSQTNHATYLGGLSIGKDDKKEAKLFTTLIINNCSVRRKVLVTKSGRYGIGPRNAEGGDVVVRFSGAPFMSVLCKTTNGYFLLGHIRFPRD
jgi:hypothetical protein